MKDEIKSLNLNFVHCKLCCNQALIFILAAWSAVKSVFPDTDIKGCSFYWSQAVMRRVAKLGLKPTYDQKQTTHVFIRKILALPYLPADHIRPAFIQLLQSTTTASQQLKQLMSYLSRTWFTSTIWSVRQWSVYRQSVRTNNDVEGNNLYTSLVCNDHNVFKAYVLKNNLTANMCIEPAAKYIF